MSFNSKRLLKLPVYQTTGRSFSNAYNSNSMINYVKQALDIAQIYVKLDNARIFVLQ